MFPGYPFTEEKVLVVLDEQVLVVLDEKVLAVFDGKVLDILVLIKKFCNTNISHLDPKQSLQLCS